MKKEESKIMGLLGLAARSGKIVVGQKILKRYISGSYKKKIVVFSSDFGESVSQILKKCEANGISHVKLSVGKKELGMCIGKREASAVGITDETFVNGLMKIIFSGNMYGGK